MTLYTVHLGNELSDLASADRAALVPDRFSLWAAVFGPFWLLRHRAWRALALVIALDAAALVLSYLGLVPVAALSPLGWLQAIWLGIEGNDMRRAALERRGMRAVDIVSAANAEAAERRFFERWRPEMVVAAPFPAPARRNVPPQPSVPHPSARHAHDVLGSFPDPGARR